MARIQRRRCGVGYGLSANTVYMVIQCASIKLGKMVKFIRYTGRTGSIVIQTNKQKHRLPLNERQNAQFSPLFCNVPHKTRWHFTMQRLNHKFETNHLQRFRHNRLLYLKLLSPIRMIFLFRIRDPDLYRISFFLHVISICCKQISIRLIDRLV